MIRDETPRLGKIGDALFFWQPHHCRTAYDQDLERAANFKAQHRKRNPE